MPGRGFASMDPERLRMIAQRGGRAAHDQGVAHTFTAEEASAAGKIGGKVSGGRRKAAVAAREARKQQQEPRKDRP